MRWLDVPVKYKQWTCRIGISHYDSNPNRPAIVAKDFDTGEPIASFTKNLDDLDYYLPNQVAIDVNNCGMEAVHVLIETGIIGEKVDEIRGGYCTYPVYKLLV